MSRNILKSSRGDSLYVNETFYALERGSSEKHQRFETGQEVKFLGYEWCSRRKPKDVESLCPVWIIRFEKNGLEYSATQDYFLHKEAWNGLVKYCADELKKAEPVVDKNIESPLFLLKIILIFFVFIAIFLALLCFMLL
jgi:hypothetical protein